MRVHWKTLFLFPALALVSCADMAETDTLSAQAPAANDTLTSVEASLAITQEPATGQEPGDLDPRGSWADIQARKQKRQLLAKNYVSMGDAAMNRGDYEGAMAHYADAFQLDPESRDAREGLRRAQSAAGGEGWTWMDSEGVAEQQSLRWAAARKRKRPRKRPAPPLAVPARSGICRPPHLRPLSRWTALRSPHHGLPRRLPLPPPRGPV